MKIGIFDPYLDTMAGGERYILSAALCLSKKHQVTLFWDLDSSSIRDSAERRFGFDLRELRFTDNIFSATVSLSKRLIKSREYDAIIYVSDGSIPTVATNLYLHFQTPVEWVHSSLKTKLKLLRVSDVFCNSAFTKSYIDKTFGLNTHILYPPILPIQMNHSSEKKNYILNVGRFGINQQGSSYKKQDVLRDVFKTMVDNGLSDWSLVFVMNADESDGKLADFKNLCKDYPIHVVVNPKNNELNKYYEQSKIYWHASGIGEDLHTHPDRAEHFGISTVEAMSAGCVPVVFNAGGQKEIVETNAHGYLFNTTEELMKKTTELITNKKQWKEFSEASQSRAKNFSIDTFCKNLNSIISIK